MKQILLAFVLFFPHSEQVIQNCEPVEEGRPYTMSCSRSSTDTSCNADFTLFKWTARDGGLPTTLISQCDKTLSCTGNNQYFTIGVERRPEISPVYYISNITINKVSLTTPYNNERKWTCDYCGIVNYCTLQIYVKPVNPRCQASEIMNNRGKLSRINLTCTMDHVYPEEKCIFQLIGQDGSRSNITKDSNLCQTDIGVEELSAGVNRFEARVGSSRQSDFDVIQPISVTPPIRLQLPKSRIECSDIDFKDGYYRGTTIRCECKLAEQGKPSGGPAWFLNNRIISRRLGSDDVVILQINYIGPDSARTFLCVGDSAIGQETPGNSISPKFAFYRNGRLNITSSDEGLPVNICCGNPGITVSCAKDSSEVNPAPRFALLVNKAIASNYRSGLAENSSYTQTFTFLPKFGGLYTVGCRVENAIFTDMLEDISTNVTIYSPVQFAEISNIKDTFETEITPGTKVVISFDISAYPNNISSTLYKGTRELNITEPYLTINYLEVSLSTQSVELILELNSSLDLTTYLLVMDNGIGSELNYTFSLEEATSGNDLPLLPLILGISAGVVLLTGIVVVVFWRLRRKPSDVEEVKENTNFDKNDTDVDSEDEENVFDNPQIEENEYDEYVDSVDGPPTIEAPRPPNTNQTTLSDNKSKVKKENKKPMSKPKPKPMPKPPKSKPSVNSPEQKGAQKSPNPGKGESSNSHLLGYYNTNKEGPVTESGKVHVPPPRPPPRNASVEDDAEYVNVRTAVAAHYDSIVPDEEDRKYLAIQEGSGSKSSLANQNEDAEEDNYYSSINEEGSKPVRVMY